MSDRERRSPSPSSWIPWPFRLVVLSLVLAPVGVSGACGGSSSGSGTIGQSSSGGHGGGGSAGGAAGGVGGGGLASPSSSGGAGGHSSGGAGGHPTTVQGTGGAPNAGGAGGLAAIGGSTGTGGITSTIPPLGTGGNGTLSWTGNGASHTSTGYYEESPSADGMSFDIVIASDAQSSGASCALTGRFPAVPPPAGSYQMADFDSPQVDGTFVARCETGTVPFKAEDRSASGQVVIAQSGTGAIEGAFVMHAARSIPGTGGSSGLVVYSGAFSVGCRNERPTTDPSCGAQPSPSP